MKGLTTFHIIFAMNKASNLVPFHLSFHMGYLNQLNSKQEFLCFFPFQGYNNLFDIKGYTLHMHIESF